MITRPVMKRCHCILQEIQETVLRLIRTADQLIHGDRTDAESVRKRLQLVDGKCEDFTMRLDARRKNLIMARNFFAHAQAVGLRINPLECKGNCSKRTAVLLRSVFGVLVFLT